jgi:hypothetical protein
MKRKPQMKTQRQTWIKKRSMEKNKFLKKNKPKIIPGVEKKTGKKKVDIYHHENQYNEHQTIIEDPKLVHHGVKSIPGHSLEKQNYEFAMDVDKIGRKRVRLRKKTKKTKN